MYNYKGASAIWNEYNNLLIDPWILSDDERQKERRAFMRALTRGIDKDIYINYVKDCIMESRPIADAKSRCFDLDFERQAERLIDKIQMFSGVIL